MDNRIARNEPSSYWECLGIVGSFLKHAFIAPARGRRGLYAAQRNCYPASGSKMFRGIMEEYIQAFDADEVLFATAEVNKLVKSLQGRKLEEGDWTSLYCRVKGVPDMGWSNLPFRDYIHDGVGVEFKLLAKANPSNCMGKSLMHPAATRTIDFDENEPAADAMAKVFSQWGAAISEFEERVRATSKTGDADIRWGVLLWAPDHSEFLYFEERLQKPGDLRKPRFFRSVAW